MEKYKSHDLSGKVAVVTGGAGVLCGPMCKALAACGASVAILNRTFEKAQRLADEITASGGKAIAVGYDAANAQSVNDAHEKVLAELGPCDILINGVGGNNPKASTADERFDESFLNDPSKLTFFDLQSEDTEAVFSANYQTALLASQVFARDMLNRGGSIINISSMSSIVPLTKVLSYSAAKSAINALTQWMAVYFVKEGIRVNAIAPGFFSAEQNKKLLWNEDGTPTERTKLILNGTPMGRFGLPEELLGTLLWLVDDTASGFVTGIIVPVDGGYSAFSGV